MVQFTIKQCAYFVAVAEAGGIAQAARAQNISQPAVAQAIDKLEALTGLALFERRHARGTELTAAGRAFYTKVRNLLAEAAAVEREAAAIAADRAGEIRLACFHTLAPFCLARLVKGYRARFPGVTVTASEGLQDELVSGLDTRELDLALLYDRALDPARLDWHVLARLKPSIILPRDHRLAARPAIRLDELADEPLVLFEGPMSRDYFLDVLATLDRQPAIALRSSSMESVRVAVGNGLGFSLTVMRPWAEQTYDGSRVVTVPIADAVAPIDVVLARKRGLAPSGLLENFADFCRSHFGGAGADST